MNTRLDETTILNITTQGDDWENIGTGTVPANFKDIGEGIGLGKFEGEALDFYYRIDTNVSAYQNMLCEVDFNDGIEIKFYEVYGSSVNVISFDFWDAVSGAMDEEDKDYFEDAEMDTEADRNVSTMEMVDYVEMLSKYNLDEFLPDDIKEMFLF